MSHVTLPREGNEARQHLVPEHLLRAGFDSVVLSVKTKTMTSAFLIMK